MKFEPPEGCTCEWYSTKRDIKVIPDIDCPVHGKGQRPIPKDRGDIFADAHKNNPAFKQMCRCPSYYAGKEAAPLADIGCPVHGKGQRKVEKPKNG